MANLATRLSALQYPFDSNDDFGEQATAARLVAWLEDRYIRQLPATAREPLRSGAPSALQDYLHEVVAPDWVLRYHRESSYYNVCSWLVNVALQFEYEATFPPAAPSVLTSDDDDLLALAAAFRVPPATHTVGTLHAVIKAARARPRPTPPSTAALPAPLLGCSESARTASETVASIRCG